MITLFGVVGGPHQVGLEARVDEAQETSMCSLIVDSRRILPMTQVLNVSSRVPEELLRLLAGSLHTAMNTWMPMINDVLIVFAPEEYDVLIKGGYTSRKMVAERLWQLTNKDMAPELRRIVKFKLKLPWPLSDIIGGSLGLTARLANWVTGAGLSAIPKFDSPDSFHIVVSGGM